MLVGNCFIQIFKYFFDPIMKVILNSTTVDISFLQNLLDLIKIFIMEEQESNLFLKILRFIIVIQRDKFIFVQFDDLYHNEGIDYVDFVLTYLNLMIYIIEKSKTSLKDLGFFFIHPIFILFKLIEYFLFVICCYFSQFSIKLID